MAVNNEQIAEQVLEAVGGKENVVTVAHCMTRLRFTLKDMGLPNEEEIKKVKGVIGVVVSGGQFQVIIGQNVPKVYAALCAIGHFQVKEGIDENIDAPKEKLTLKGVGTNILNFLSGSMVPLIPILMAAAMFKTVEMLIGPNMLGLVTAKSDLYILLEFLYNAGFYFMPVYLGYTSAKKIGATPVLGMYMGGILIAPKLLELVTAGKPFTVFGIPCSLHNYSQTVFPILLSVVVLYFVEKLLKKIIPDVLSTVFVPFLTMVIMAPISLCALAPLGSFLGDYLGIALTAFGEHGGFIAIAVVAALWEFLVMTGMHTALLMPVFAQLMAGNYDNFVLVASLTATFATYGMALGGSLRIKNKDEKSLSIGYFISGFLGGVTEPALYGLGFKYKRPFIGLMAGGILGGAYAGLMHVQVCSLGAANFLAVLRYVNAGTSNFVNAIIGLSIAFVSAAVATYLFGFTKEDLKA